MKYIALGLFLLFSNSIFAQREGIGFEISSKYLHISNEYVVSVKHYRNTGVQILPYLSYRVNSSCGLTHSTIPLGYSDSSSTNCSLNKIPVSFYIDTISLSTNCQDYLLTLDTCCIQGSVSSGGALHVKLFIKHDSLRNNSPFFIGNEFIYASLNDTSIFDFSAFDTDGDSLQYEFYQDPWISNYFPGYSYNKPFGLNSYVNLNSSTGTLAFAPQRSGKYFICIRVNEFRNGNLIGFVTKEIVCFVSTNNSNCLSTNIYENSISKVNVFPNPSSAIVHIKGANNVKIVSLMDISGKNI